MLNINHTYFKTNYSYYFSVKIGWDNSCIELKHTCMLHICMGGAPGWFLGKNFRLFPNKA